MIKKIYLAKPRGFCAGVKRAVKILNILLRKFGPPIYVRHQIVHNRHVVSSFEKKGVVFVEDINKIPDGSIVVFSAHGSPPLLYEKAKKKKLKVFDAVCPLVAKVHIEAKKYAEKGFFIFYIGHKNHPEAIGVASEVLPESIALIENYKEAEKIKAPQEHKLIALTQTTLSFDDTKKIINMLQKRFPCLILPPAFDICYSTQNRQKAVKELAKKVDLVLVVGSPESSNSQRLKETVWKTGGKAYLINDLSEIKKDWFESINILGITAGASTPEESINEVIEYFALPKADIQELEVVKEKIAFPVPMEVL